MVWWLSDTRFVAIVVTCRRLIAARRLARATDSLEDAGGGNIVEHGLVGGRSLEQSMRVFGITSMEAGRTMRRWTDGEELQSKEWNAMQCNRKKGGGGGGGGVEVVLVVGSVNFRPPPPPSASLARSPSSLPLSPTAASHTPAPHHTL